MKTVIVFVVMFFSVGFAQNCFDQTKEVKKILRSSEVEMHSAKVIGACLDSANQTLHLTITLDPIAVNVYSGYLPVNGWFAFLTLHPFMTSTKKIYEKLLMLNNYILYVVEFKNIVDKYGNFSHKEKKILSTMSMSKETAKKINWKFVNDNFYSAFTSGNDANKVLLFKMLDHYEVNPY